MRKNQVVLVLSVFLLFSMLTVSAFPSDSIYVMKTDKAPVIDGKIDENEWFTEEEVFLDLSTGVSLTTGETFDLNVEIVTLRDADNLYVLYKFGIPSSAPQTGNMSAGIALAPAGVNVGGMASFPDRKLAYYNGSDTTLYDLHFTVQEQQPGADDTSSTGFEAKFGKSESSGSVRNFFFEYKIPLVSTNSTEDVSIEEGTTLAFILNPFANAYDGLGHGGKSTGKLKVSFEKRPFFITPEPGMNGSTLIFISIFAVLTAGTGLMFILTGKNEKLAEKTWAINVSEKSARVSLLNEIAYYNSNFLAMVLTVFLLTYTLSTVIYGNWAQWYFEQPNPRYAGEFDKGSMFIYVLLTWVPFIINLIALFDLGRRNENLALKDIKERTKVGVDMNSSPKLWILPVTFLSLVLFMLTFIGIDVIS